MTPIEFGDGGIGGAFFRAFFGGVDAGGEEPRCEPGGGFEEPSLEPLAETLESLGVAFARLCANRTPRPVKRPRARGRKRRRRVERGAETEANAERVGGVGDARVRRGLVAKRLRARRESRVSEPSATRDARLFSFARSVRVSPALGSVCQVAV